MQLRLRKDRWMGGSTLFGCVGDIFSFWELRSASFESEGCGLIDVGSFSGEYGTSQLEGVCLPSV